MSVIVRSHGLGGGFKYLLFSPLLGEDEPILTIFFQKGWNHQLVGNYHEPPSAITKSSPGLCWCGHFCPCGHQSGALPVLQRAVCAMSLYGKLQDGIRRWTLWEDRILVGNQGKSSYSTIPYAPCMEYLLAFAINLKANVVRYSFYGAHGNGKLRVLHVE